MSSDARYELVYFPLCIVQIVHVKRFSDAPHSFVLCFFFRLFRLDAPHLNIDSQTLIFKLLNSIGYCYKILIRYLVLILGWILR